jgi:hypothetical protein
LTPWPGVIALGFFYLLLMLGVWLLLALILRLHKQYGHSYRLPYEADTVLFTPGQLALLAVLERVLGRDYRVYGRVRVVDVIGLRPRPRLNRAARRRAWARLGDRQFDFLVCMARTGTICCAVNLTPRPRPWSWPVRDSLEAICAAAGLPLVQLREGDVYAAPQLALRLREAMSVRLPAPVPTPPPVQDPWDDAEDEETAEADAILSDLSEVLAREGLPPQLRSVAPPPAAPVQAAPAATVAVEPTRVEPTLSSVGDLDLGPEFRIDADLEDDEQPRRLQRR